MIIFFKNDSIDKKNEIYNKIVNSTCQVINAPHISKDMPNGSLLIHRNPNTPLLKG
jgi:hypothetical protein